MANPIVNALEGLAQQQPNCLAIETEQTCLTWEQLWARTRVFAKQLERAGIQRLALLAENSLDWVVTDLACIQANIVLVPLPVFFTSAQQRHVLDQAGIDSMLVGDNMLANIFEDWHPDSSAHSEFGSLWLWRRTVERVQALPEGTGKVTFTSGSTGAPKGVCLSHSQLAMVAQSLALATGHVPRRRHLVALPLVTLLENISGIYLPILCGTQMVVLPGAKVGLTGSSQFDPVRFGQCLQQYQPNSLVLTPALLLTLLGLIEASPELGQPLTMVAVGGARVSTGLLQRASRLAVPVFEGYGLSECGSVVALNVPGAELSGSVGRILPHCEVSVDNFGELYVSGATMLGYLGHEPQQGAIATGDLGRIDPNGFLHLEGRRKNVIITRFGRNVSPEWLESLTLAVAGLEQCVISAVDDEITALVFTPSPGLTEAALHQLNNTLPDYAQVQRYLIVAEPLHEARPSLLTPNGRPRRNAIDRFLLQHATASQSLLSRQVFHVKQERDMPFFEQLNDATAKARQQMLTAPVIEVVKRHQMSLKQYQAFLTQAYHHVKHTTPLLMSLGGRLPERYEWLRAEVGEYIEEEMGHQEWILNDLRACGGDADAVRVGTGDGAVCTAIELMVAYLYHQIDRGNPMAFWGMVWVLEGTSVSIGGDMARLIQQTLHLPDEAMSYLSSHSSLDQEHIKTFERLMDQVRDPQDQQAIIDGALMVYRLYGDMLRGLAPAQTPQQQVA